MAIKITNLLEVATRGGLRDWLKANAATQREAWVYCTVKPAENRILYLDAVEEAICFGWIDSTKKKLDGGTAQRISPRTKKGNWTELNKERARRLEKLGLMTDSGRAVLPDMSPKSFAVAPEVLAALQSDQRIWENYLALPELYKRIRIDNIQGYLKYKDVDDTYNNRLQKFLDQTRAGKLYGEWNDGGRLLDY
jgi:uncharacterized protein YdeI (YjbR/CyaY-like superfamily)